MQWERSLIIPMHDEARRIVATIDVLGASWAAGPETELIFVDDGSTDGTSDVVEKALASAGLDGRVLRLETNRGKGAAVRAGIMDSNAPVVGFVDADLSTDIDEVRRVFATVERGDAVVAIATRAHARSDIAVHQPAFRQLSGKAFNLVLRILRLTAFHDTQCGLKAFTAPIAREVFGALSTSGFAFDIEVLARVERAGHAVTEVPVRWSHVEESSVRAIRDSSRMLRDAMRVRRMLRPEPRPPAAAMHRDAYDAMSLVEDRHWWFRAKRALVMDALESVPLDGVAVDVGCGSGAMVRELSARWPVVVGTDFEKHALDLSRQRFTGLGGVQAAAEFVPLRTAIAGCVVSLDVIEHLDDDVAGLREYRRVVEDGGLVVVAVPAYRWAWSDHDVALGHRRRYTRRSLRRALEAAGLKVERTTYFHSWLVPPAFVLRRTPARRLVKGSAEEASFVGPRVNALLRFVAETERRVLGRVDLPVGLSVLATARR